MNVTLLTQDYCLSCDDAKETLRRLSSEYPISVTVLELGSPEGVALAERVGVIFAPSVVLDGVLFSEGQLSERALRRALEQRLAAGKQP